MHFKPIYSFNIHRFDYDTSSHRLLVHYYDGRQAICAVPPIVVAVLRASSQPETVLLRYAKTYFAIAPQLAPHKHFVC
jgi:hypothetical protein